MLLYTTKFPVKPSLTAETFIDKVLTWVTGSPHYHFDTAQLPWEDNNLYATTANAALEILQFPEAHMVAVSLENHNEKQERWSNFFYLSTIPNDNWVATQLDCQRPPGQTTGEKPHMKLPYLLKQLQEEGFSAPDDNLPVTNTPINITCDNAADYGKILFGTGHYEMPIVYVSVTRQGEYALDVVRLAKLLSGTAHVLVEADLAVNQLLLQETKGRKPYYGAVTIFFSQHHARRFSVQELQQLTHCEATLSQMIYEWLLQVENDPRFSWYHWSIQRHEKQQARLVAQAEEAYRVKQIQNAQELEQAKNMANISKMIMNDANRDLQKLKEQNYNLQTQLASYDNQRVHNMVTNAGQPILFQGDEAEFYSDEQQDIVLDILAEVLKNLGPCRRKDILTALLAANPIGGLREEKLIALKNCLNTYSGMDSNTRSKLKEVGLMIHREDTHYNLRFFNDDRYPLTLPKTPSDRRGGKNSFQTAIKKCF